ncbi:MAG: TlpA family protein disulfide reductase [Planctomycetes bacterium]|nr:TlpA family protein disulfide reductase [Planctomycetota bacterium]
MKNLRLAVALSAAISMACLAFAQAPPASSASTSVAASSPATSTAPAGVPEEMVNDIHNLFILPQNASQAEQLRLAIERSQKIIQLGSAAEASYPDAQNLYKVRLDMLAAGEFQFQDKPDEQSLAQLSQIAKRLSESNAPAEARIRAESVLANMKVSKLAQSSPADADKEILALATKYETSDAAHLAALHAANIAMMAGRKDAAEKMAGVLQEKFLDAPQVRSFLRNRMNRHPDIGKIFQAELVKLDGAKLKLPDDLAGKVVVVDFWATWCGPCKEEIPNMKAIYEKYKDKGVEFVGVSLDKPDQKEQLAKFVEENGVKWTQTYSGKFFDDPTARKYGVGAIPNVWLIGKDGKIISDNALETLDELIEKALK